MTYEEQRRLAQDEIFEDREKEIKEQIKKRLLKSERLHQELEVLTKEIDALVEEGKLKNIEDYIKVEPSLSDGATHIGLSIMQ